MNNDNVVKKVAFQKGEKYHLQSLKVNEHETTPPDYFNEGSLLKAMENLKIIYNLKKRNMLTH